MDLQTLRHLGHWNERLDPDRPLDLSDPEQASLYVDLSKLRGPGDVASEMADAVTVAAFGSHPASVQLLAGFRGTGKSTELSRLRALLPADGFTVLAFGADDYLSMSDAPSVEQLGLALAAGIAEQAGQVLGQKDPFRTRGPWERIRDFLQQEVSEVEVSMAPPGMEIKATLKESRDYTDKLGALLATRREQLRTFVHDIVHEVANASAPRQLVLLVDGLDKYLVPLDQVAGVYRRMADLFFQQHELLKLPRCHVVYVVPPYLGFLHKGLAERYGRLPLLPSVKVRERPSRGGEPVQAGLVALEMLAARRVELDLLLGASRGAAMQEIGLWSGGHVRDLFTLLRAVVLRAASTGLPVPLDDVKAAIGQGSTTCTCRCRSPSTTSGEARRRSR